MPEVFNVFHAIGDDLCVELDDKGWARKTYKKAFDLAKDTNNFFDLAESLVEKLGDSEWAKSTYEKALELAEEDKEVEEQCIEDIKERMEELK